MSKRKTFALFLCMSYLLVSCSLQSTSLPSPTGTNTPTSSLPSPSAYHPSPSKTTIPLIDIIPDIPVNIEILEEPVSLTYSSLLEGVPDQGIIYRIFDHGDYIVRFKTPSGDDFDLFSCSQCAFPLGYLGSIQNHDQSWLITSEYFDPYTSGGRVLLVDLRKQSALSITCQSSVEGQDCRLIQMSASGLLFSTTRNQGTTTYFYRTPVGEWFSLTGALFDGSEMVSASFFRYFNDQGFLFRKTIPGQETSSLFFYSLLTEQLSDWSEILTQGNHSLVFLGSTPDQENLAFAGYYNVEDDTQPIHRYQALIICPIDVFNLRNLTRCEENVDLASILPMQSITSITWVNEDTLLWVDRGGIGRNMTFGSIDITGNMRTLYSGDPVILGDLSEEGFMLFLNDGIWGIINVFDGEINYPGLPEDAFSPIWKD